MLPLLQRPAQEGPVAAALAMLQLVLPRALAAALAMLQLVLLRSLAKMPLPVAERASKEACLAVVAVTHPVHASAATLSSEWPALEFAGAGGASLAVELVPTCQRRTILSRHRSCACA